VGNCRFRARSFGSALSKLPENCRAPPGRTPRLRSGQAREGARPHVDIARGPEFHRPSVGCRSTHNSGQASPRKDGGWTARDDKNIKELNGTT
jgi:hypothetical protein